jgi:hypothetical protein
MERNAVSTNPQLSADLPIRRNLKLVTILSFMVAILMAGASIGGLLYKTIIYPSEELLQSFFPNDVANLLIGLPMLLASMWLTRRGKLIGLLFWPGALFYVVYNYIIYVFAMPLNLGFILHLLILMLSVYSLINLVASIDATAVQQRLSGTVPERLAGGVLTALGSLFLLLVIGAIVSALIQQTSLPETELALHVADFLITPSWIICGVLLWQRKAFGYVAGLGLLFQASMLFIGLILVLVLLPILTTAPFSLVDVVVTFILGLICFIPLGLFIRGVLSDRKIIAE